MQCLPARTARLHRRYPDSSAVICLDRKRILLISQSCGLYCWPSLIFFSCFKPARFIKLKQTTKHSFISSKYIFCHSTMLQKVYKKYAPSKHNPNTLKKPINLSFPFRLFLFLSHTFPFFVKKEPNQWRKLASKCRKCAKSLICLFHLVVQIIIYAKQSTFFFSSSSSFWFLFQLLRARTFSWCDAFSILIFQTGGWHQTPSGVLRKALVL